jgi:hypothetical protein
MGHFDTLDAMHAVPRQLDHLVLAGPDLGEAVGRVEDLLGVKMLAGGRHPDWGTSNAILPLGPSSYLEVIGPDPEGDAPPLFGIAQLGRPRLVTWAAKGQGLTRLVEEARGRGVELGTVRRGTRARPDGTKLEWELTDPFAARGGGVLPFFIDWAAGGHPAQGAPASVSLIGLRGRHPEAAIIGAQLRGLGIEMEVEARPEPGLVAVFRTATGEVEIS